MSNVWRSIVLVAGLVLWPLAAFGQRQAAQSVLTVPDSGIRLLCRTGAEKSRAPRDSGLTDYRFVVGESSYRADREIDVWFDSLGRPRRFLEHVATVTDAGGASVEAVAAVYDSAGRVGGDHMSRSRASGADRGTRPDTLPPLSADDERHLKALTAWLWKHRCGSGRPGAGQRAAAGGATRRESP